jgi:hypothetical protein
VVRDEPSEVDDGQSFTWDCASPGVRTVVEHVLTPRVAGGCRATLRVIHHGPAAGLVGAVLDRLTRRYLRTEAEGLKARSEGRPSLIEREPGRTRYALSPWQSRIVVDPVAEERRDVPSYARPDPLAHGPDVH